MAEYNKEDNREWTEVTCAECGQLTKVPFKPDGQRPVYCRDCFEKRRPKRPEGNRRFRD